MQLGATRHGKARKRHLCAHCATSILPGEAQATWTWKDGGEVERLYVHEECNDPCADYCSDGDCCADGDDVLRGVPLALLPRVPCRHCGRAKDDHDAYRPGRPGHECGVGDYDALPWPDLQAWTRAQPPAPTRLQRAADARAVADTGCRLWSADMKEPA